jgi:uncharacterized protein
MMPLNRQSIFGSCVFASLALGATASPAQISVGSGLRVDQPAVSMKDQRDRNVVKQRSDYSCGAAALATLLHYGFGDKITERDILAAVFDPLSTQEKAIRQKTGFSLLDLQRVAQARGYNAAGFRLAPEQLRLLDGPVIVFIEPRGYKHFAVLRGVRGNRVYLADPSRGNIRMRAHTFLEGWLQADRKGIIFVVEPKTGTHSKTPLALGEDAIRYPEIMSAREMLAVGNPFLRSSELPK